MQAGISVDKEKKAVKKDLNKAIHFDGARLFIRDMRIAPPWGFDINQDFSFVKLHFDLKGRNHYEPSTEDGVPVSLDNGQYNLFFLPKVKGTLTHYADEVKSVELECDEKYLMKLYKSEFYQKSGAFGEAIRKRMAYKAWEESQEIPPFLLKMLNEIVEYTNLGDPDLVCLEGKIKKIFDYLFLIIKDQSADEKLIKVSVREQGQMAQVERILRNSLRTPVTLDELAHSIGTNRFKLGRSFKMVYHETIGSYHSRLRMERAEELLINSKMNVSEVAFEVGYKNPQHFTVAFKRHFGHLPSELKVRS